MATVTNSAANAAVNLFSTVTTTANAVSTAITAVGNAFDVLNCKSTDWLKETRKRSAGFEKHLDISIADEVSAAIAAGMQAREDSFKGKATFKTAYESVFTDVLAAVQAA